MRLLALGVNHRTAPVALRERLAVADDRVGAAARELTSSGRASEAAVVSTCNRTELYCRQKSLDTDRLVHWVSGYAELPEDEIRPHLYKYPDDEAVRHAFRVASGLDSMVLGEPQILGQMKDAFADAHRLGATGKILNRLFQNTFSVAKRVRTDTAIGVSAVSVAYAAVALAKRIFADLGRKTVLLIGAGTTVELVARHLKDNGAQHIIVANRSIERAETVAAEVGGQPILLAEMPNRLAEADIVVSSTASTLPVLGKGAVERALRRRRHKPMLLVDIAVPRDIEPEVGELRDVYLYTVDDLEGIVEQNLAARREAAESAEQIIDLEVGRFMHWLRSLDSVPTVRALRDRADTLSAKELGRARARLQRGEDPEVVIEMLARALTRKFTHAPSRVLRHADASERADLLNAVRRLFDIEER